MDKLFIHDLLIKFSSNKKGDYVPDYNYKIIAEEIYKKFQSNIHSKEKFIELIESILYRNARNGGDFLPDYKFNLVENLINNEIELILKTKKISKFLNT